MSHFYSRSSNRETCSRKSGCNAHQGNKLVCRTVWTASSILCLRWCRWRVYGWLQTTENLCASDGVWCPGASCGCNDHDHNVLARRKSPQSCKQSLLGKCRQLRSCRQGHSSRREEQNARLRSRAMRLPEDAFQHLSTVRIPIQLSEKPKKIENH